MAYWRSLVNISPSEEGDYYIATINGEEKKVKWNGENFECNNVVAWLEPSENQTAEEAFREFHSNIANFMLQNPTYYTKHVEKKETIDRKKVIKGGENCINGHSSPSMSERGRNNSRLISLRTLQHVIADLGLSPSNR